MLISEFNAAIEQFCDVLLNSLTSSRPLVITNAYLKQVHGSKYMYLSLKLEKQPEDRSENEVSTQNIEMTISYDRFYQIPVLHFRVNHSIGSMSKYAAIDTHPTLHTPYMVVHACETENTMKPTDLAGIEYLKLWFAMHLTMVFPELQLRDRV